MSQSRVLDLLRESPGAALRTYNKNLDSKVYTLRPTFSVDFQVFEPGSLKQAMCEFFSCAHFILLEENFKLQSVSDSLSYSLSHELTMTRTRDPASPKTIYPLSLPLQLQKTLAFRNLATFKIAVGGFCITKPGYDRIPPSSMRHNLRCQLNLRAQHGFTRPQIKVEEVRAAALEAGISEADIEMILSNARLAKGIRLPEEYNGRIPSFTPLLGNSVEWVSVVLKPAGNHIFRHRLDANEFNSEIEELRCAADCVLLEQFQLLDSIPQDCGLLVLATVDIVVGSPDASIQSLKLMPIFMDKSPAGLLQARMNFTFHLFSLGFEHKFPDINDPHAMPPGTRPLIVSRSLKALKIEICTTTFEQAKSVYGTVLAGPGIFASCHKDICGRNCPNTVYKEHILARLHKLETTILTKSSRRS